MNDLISIIVPVYNVEKYLEQCIKSLINQTYKNIEIILVDDGSTDKSGKICDKYSFENKYIKTFHKKNNGLGMARNTGLEHAKGNYVIFVDSDDYLASDLCEKLYYNLINNRVDYCKSGYYKIDDNFNILTQKKYINELFIDGSAKLEMFPRMLGSLPNKKDVIEPSVWASIYNLKIIRKNNIQFPSERELISEDIVFNLEYMQYANGAVTLDYCGYFYRFNPNSLSKSYREDRFERVVLLYKYLFKKLTNLKYDKNTFIRLQTLFFINLKVIIGQEKKIISKKSNYEIKNKIKKICEDDTTKEIVKSYPIRQQHLKQKIFLYLIKYKKIYLISLFIKLNII